MRFPNTPFMKRTFDLAQNRGLNVTLIPYIMQMVKPPNTFLFYNNTRVHNQEQSVTSDPFHVGSYVTDPDLRTPEGVHRRVSEVIQPFRNLFRHYPNKQTDIATAMDRLFKATNTFSMRSYMFANNMDPKDISWCETLDKSTGWYDRALTESKRIDILRGFLNLKMMFWQLLSRAWPSSGPIRPFLVLRYHQIPIAVGTVSSTCRLFPTIQTTH